MDKQRRLGDWSNGGSDASAATDEADGARTVTVHHEAAGQRELTIYPDGSHEGRAVVRTHPEEGTYTVLCPAGHVEREGFLRADQGVFGPEYHRGRTVRCSGGLEGLNLKE